MNSLKHIIKKLNYSCADERKVQEGYERILAKIPLDSIGPDCHIKLDQARYILGDNIQKCLKELMLWTENTFNLGNIMTYNYHYDVATSRSSLIIKLLLRWKGSVWQATYVELAIWTVCYCIISVIYRFGLNQYQQDGFERFVLFCDNRLSYIPLNFMLGFFVQIVVNRWSQQFANLGMIDNIALFTSSLVSGSDERGRQLRRNIVRYCCLSQALVFRDIHVGVRKRFPNLDTLVAAGFMQQHEMDKFDNCKSRYAKYWLPFNWSLHLLNVARKEGRIHSDMLQNTVAQEIRAFRSGLSLIWTNDWVPLPIMYPQLITLATYAYFVVCLVSRQFIITKTAKNAIEYDIYIPFMSMMELVFYMGWLKVAMGLLNPFGEDDEDFDCNFLLDRNMTVGLTSVDEAFDDVPDVQPDIFYNDTVSPLYSKDAAAKNVKFYLGSANAGGAEKPFHLLSSISHLLHIPMKPEEENEQLVEMVPHPINERVDQYLQANSKNRGTSVVSIVNPKARRMDSFSSAVFRRRKATKNSEENVTTLVVPRQNRASSDVGAYSNNMFLDIESLACPPLKRPSNTYDDSDMPGRNQKRKSHSFRDDGKYYRTDDEEEGR